MEKIREKKRGKRLTARGRPHELAAVLAVALVVVTHDREVVLGVEVEVHHRVDVHPGLVHVEVLVRGAVLGAVPEAEVLGFAAVESRFPSQGHGVVGRVDHLGGGTRAL